MRTVLMAGPSISAPSFGTTNAWCTVRVCPSRQCGATCISSAGTIASSARTGQRPAARMTCAHCPSRHAAVVGVDAPSVGLLAVANTDTPAIGRP